MANPADPHPSDPHASTGDGAGAGRSTLGPHVVGQRVVVRRLVRGETGSSGGPAMTDLLGVCTAWESDHCVVRPEAGPEVRIALADIVSGKPVPPRPLVRHRVSPRRAQLRAMALFPGLETEPLGDWVLRRSPHYPARRANSVLAFGPSGVSDDVERVEAFYERPVAAVLPDSEEEAALRERGWRREGVDADTLFMIAGVGRALRACAAGADLPATEVREEADLGVARIGDAASGIAGYGDDWVGIRAVEVMPDQRRQGLARSVVGALLDWGAAQGATTAYLQVTADNRPALSLYEALGFTEHHAYRYLAAGR